MAIIDVLWNGIAESVKMAELCDVYEVNCAAHNYHGWLGTVICAHFCAAGSTGAWPERCERGTCTRWRGAPRRMVNGAPPNA